MLDPFAGSGSTGVAAVLSGRRSVLIEAKREFVDMCIDRVNRAEVLRLQMLDV